MTNFEKTGYVINPKKCEGCIHAYKKGTGAGYLCCDIYLDSKRTKRPTPDKHGNCIHKNTGPRPKRRITWEDI